MDGTDSPKPPAAGTPADDGEMATGAVTPEPGASPSARAILGMERGEADRGAPRPRATRRAGTIIAIAGGAALLGTAVLLLATARGPRPVVQASGARIAGSVAGMDPFSDDGGYDAESDALDEAAPVRPAPWRVVQLRDDVSVTLVEGVIGRRPLLAALTGAGLSQGEAQRVTASLAEVRNVDRFDPKDTFAIARDRASGHVVAYEFASSPVDVWQAREDADAGASQPLDARRLEVVPESVRIRKAVVVGADLRASLTEAGLGPVDDVMTMLDDALDGHTELSNIRPGARMRIVATQERVGGELVRCASLDAVEYFPAAPNAPSVRVYWFGQDEGPSKRHGWYDAKGRQPIHGGWRMPVPLARVVSRFNPRRMHPVLHVIMPHNGVDLAAPMGAPVYATAAGVVLAMGYDGPCGNKLEIEHPHGMTSVYCHLSRFASGMRVGQHVEQRQLVAYVGQTGRATGPHLHFGMRRGSVFIDPMTLRFDGVRVIPRTRRDEFDRLRGDLDGELDTIPLPPPLGGAVDAPEPDTPVEDYP